jgi:thiamine transport system permease protein
VICLTSFAVVITLGGGPSATTLELAIYQAVRFEFDLGQAAGLAGCRWRSGSIATLAAWLLRARRALAPGWTATCPAGALPAGGAGVTWARWRWRRPVPDPAAGCGAAARPAGAGRSAGLGLPAAGRSVGGGAGVGGWRPPPRLTLALAAARGPARWSRPAATLPLATSGLVLGTGLFLMMQPLCRR